MENNKIVYLGTGRRKTSIARVMLKPGSGKLTVNNSSGEGYLQNNPIYLYQSKQALIGGGLTGQAEAIKLGVARALCKMNIEYRPALKSEGCLSRDARAKERKKYGLRKARKAPQYSKR